MNLDDSAGLSPPQLPAPEPDLMPEMLFERAVALRGSLWDEQDEADERGATRPRCMRLLSALDFTG